MLVEKRQLFDAILSRKSGPQSMGFSQQGIFGLVDLKMPSPQGGTNGNGVATAGDPG